MSRLVKRLLIVVAILVVVGVVALALVWANLGTIVKVGVEKGGTVVLGVPVTLEDADVRPVRGKVGLDQLVIGAPEGFEERMFVLGHAHVEMDVGSLRTDEMIISDVVIDGAEITLEFAGVMNTNWGTLLESLKSEEVEGQTEEEKAASQKKVKIDRIAFTNCKVRVAGLPGVGSVPVPLPNLEITGIGTKSGGATVRQALYQIITQMLVGVAKAVGSIIPSEQLMELGGQAAAMVGEAAGSVGEAADAAANVAGGAAGAVAGVSGGAAGAVGGAAKGVAGTAKGVIGGIFGGGDDEEQDE